MKLLRIFLPVALVAMSLSLMAHADDIKIVTEEWRPYSFEENGVVKGSSTEIVLDVMKRAGVSYTINVLPWARAFQNATTLPNVLIFALGRSEERENKFKWVGPVTPSNIAYMYRLRSRKEIVVNDLEDAKKYKVATND